MNNIDPKLLIIISFFVLVNLIAFLIMLWDKMKSRKGNERRISEGMMFFMAAVFGSVGVYAGMLVFRHKTQKWYFLIGIPMLMLENCSFLYLFYILNN